MYVCGITPYDETHLGHARAYITFDIIHRHLKFLGYKVKYVQNITDIDDKIIQKSKAKGQNYKEIAKKYSEAYFKVMEELNVLPPTKYVYATEHIKDMVKWIKQLVKKEFAYVVDSDVYFSVSKFRDYGRLSKRNLEDMKSGARVEVDERKNDPLDFALWKGSKENEPAWESPWGMGRPGWHIECSVMSTKYLGEQFDIHGGGLDLVFPHHENEIAQTEAITQKPWVKYWIHNGFVNVNRQKMSKSLGNFFTLNDIFKKFPPEVVRFFILLTHYRSPINFTDQQLKDAQAGLQRIYDTIDRLDYEIKHVKGNMEGHGLDAKLLKKDQHFIEEMNDDFNTASAIGIMFEIVTFANQIIDKKVHDKKLLSKTRKSLLGLLEVLGFKPPKKAKTINSDIEALISKREEARGNKDFKLADQIRDELREKGIEIEDTPSGTRWKSL